jgi:hypothetical protein
LALEDVESTANAEGFLMVEYRILYVLMRFFLFEPGQNTVGTNAKSAQGAGF